MEMNSKYVFSDQNEALLDVKAWAKDNVSKDVTNGDITINNINIAQGACRTVALITFKISKNICEKKVASGGVQRGKIVSRTVARYVCKHRKHMIQCYECQPKPATLAQIIAHNNIE